MNKMKNLHLILGTALMMLCFACSTTRDNNLAYFKDISQSANGMLPATAAQPITLHVDDEITVAITSASPEATAIYNAPLANVAARGDAQQVAGTPRLMSHVVDRNGNITLPVLGAIKVEGLTTTQVEQAITQRLASTVRDPYVSVQMVGFYVNVMGEVKQPQRLKVEKQQFTVLDALAACGDLTEYGERANVFVIRNEDGSTHYEHLDLSSTELFKSSAFFLRQNDVVYVMPNKIKTDNSKYNQNNAFKLSVISTVVSAVSVIASLVIALAVK